LTDTVRRVIVKSKADHEFLFVCNKIDYLDVAEQSRKLGEIREKLEKSFEQFLDTDLVGFSTKQAANARYPPSQFGSIFPFFSPFNKY
jgi:GTP-binding protein EngB required for normal cell division